MNADKGGAPGEILGHFQVTERHFASGDKQMFALTSWSTACAFFFFYKGRDFVIKTQCGEVMVHCAAWWE